MTKKTKIVGIVIIAVIAIIAILSFINRKPKQLYEFAKAERKDLVQTVSETGTVKSADEIELNFQNTGKIAKIPVHVGDKVSSTQILAELDYKDLSIREKDALASLEIARANLNKLISGATQYEINTKESSVKKAEIEYQSSLNELSEIKNSVLKNASQAEADAIISADTNISKAQVAIDNINTILTNEDADGVLGVKNSSLISATKASYENSKSSISRTRTIINTARTTKSRSDIKTALNETINSANKTFGTLLDCYQLLEYSITSTDFTQTELDTFKSTISSQETIVSASLSSLQTALNNLNDTDTIQNGSQISGNQQITNAQSKVDSYYHAWKLAQAQLEELKAPARKQDITLYQAQVRQAESSLDSIRNQIENSIIRAPIDGVVTTIEYKKGEQISLSKPAIKMLSENRLEIEVDISESDITKVSPNNDVEITLDALPEETKLYGKVYDIDPAETVIQDVIYYKTKIAFDIPEDLIANIKPGMTANAIITTKNKKDVLVIPSRAIIEKNGDGKFVKITDGKSTKDISIKTGLYGDDGLVEVVSGLSDGQEIITSTTENTK